MNYVIADIHNDKHRFREMLKKLDLKAEDRIFLLGDLFDRGVYCPDPVGVYFTTLELGDRCTAIAGNHDRWLARYILDYYELPTRKRKMAKPYRYNTFELLKDRLTEVDMMKLGKWIMNLPLQQEVCVEGKRFLLAHAMTSDPADLRDDVHYYMGDDWDEYLENGVSGYISISGHAYGADMSRYGGEFLDAGFASVWQNGKKNVYMIDSGCGYSEGRLACLCLETMERIYVSY